MPWYGWLIVAVVVLILVSVSTAVARIRHRAGGVLAVRSRGRRRGR
jgi:hypothetical protein